MSTGDVQASVERLKGELRHIRYPADLDATGAKLGMPAALLPVLNYVLLKFSRHVAHQLASSGYELQGKTDARFVEAAFKIFRDKFGLRPVLTTAQFLEQGFAERKLGLMSDVIAYCKSFHNAAVRRARLAAASAPSKSGSAVMTKSGVSQTSKASRTGTSKSTAGKATTKVQRHSAQPDATDSDLLKARLGPSGAQLAEADMSHNLDPNLYPNPNFWAPSAAAMPSQASKAALPARHAMPPSLSSQGFFPASAASPQQSYASQPPRVMDVFASNTVLASEARGQLSGAADNRPTDLPQLWSWPAHGSISQTGSMQQQDLSGYGHVHQAPAPVQHHPSQRLRPQSGFAQKPDQIPDPDKATAAWFSNPAYANTSPLPSPDKQPRSHPPPQPHPSSYPHTAQPSTAHPHFASHKQGTAGVPHASQIPSRPGTSHAGSSLPEGNDTEFQIRQGLTHRHYQEHVPHTHAEAHSVPQQETAFDNARPGRAFPDLPARFVSQSQMSMPPQQQDNHQQPGWPPNSPLHVASQQAQYIGTAAPPAAPVEHSSRSQHQPGQTPRASQQAQHGSQASLQASRPPVLQDCHQQPNHPDGYSRLQAAPQHAVSTASVQQHQQAQQLLMAQLLQQQPPPQQQQCDGQGVQEYKDVMLLVQQLQQRLSAAEQWAAVVRAEAEDRAETLEARITLLEGRVKFVEGELAAERERTCTARPLTPAARTIHARHGSRAPAAVLVACASPSGKAKQQALTAASPLAKQDRHATSAAEHHKDAMGSPTQSTAKTPARGNGAIGAHNEGVSELPLQSPLQKAYCTPGSPTSSLQSYTSTKELIENIQNRYLEAQSFLKSYKL